MNKHRSRSRVPKIVGRALVTLTGAVALALGSIAALPAHADPAEPSVLFVVDTSGSMYGTPLEQAKEALRAGIDALAPGQAAGLRSFEGECGDGGRLLVPVGTDNRDELESAANGLWAGGGTPTPDALRAAANDLPSSGDRTIILISDGYSTCGDPCVTAAELKDQLGIDFRVHAVGFNAPSNAESELSCIANVTGGQYFTATNTEELSSAISSAVTTGSGDLRPGIVCGSPTFIGVRGSNEDPQTPDLAYYRVNASKNKPYHEDGTVDLGIGSRLAPMFDFLQRQSSVDYDFNFMPVAYPAIPVNPLDRQYPAGYAESVEIGAANLKRIVTALYDKCDGDTRVALAGYSQGANVINRYLAQNAEEEEVGIIKSVVFFGDPNARPGRVGERHEGTATSYTGLVVRMNMEADADIRNYLSGHRNVVSSFCLSRDIICNPRVNSQDTVESDLILGYLGHGSYGSSNTKITCPVTGQKNTVLYECAAYRIMQDLGYSLPAAEPKPTLLQRGQQVLISLGGWLANQPGVTIFASDPQVVGTFETDEDGNALLAVNVPDNAEMGEHHIIVEQDGRSARIPVTVVESTSSAEDVVFSFGPEDGLDDQPDPGTGSSGLSSGSAIIGTGSAGGRGR